MQFDQSGRQGMAVNSLEAPAAGTHDSPYRVLAWWDVDMYVGPYRKRKLTARPLRNLERTLGHRVHVESRWVHSRLPDGVWKLEAYNYIDVADPAFAAFFVLNQMSGLSEWFHGSGFKPVTTPSDDWDADTICRFYWSDYHGPKTYRHIQSGGVLLSLVDKSPSRSDRHFPYHFERFTRPRPVVKPNRDVASRSDFLVSMTVHFVCDNRQELVQDHWPNLMKRYAFGRDDQVEFGPQPKDGEPNEIAVRKTMVGVSDHEAVAYCLARTEQCRFKLGGAEGTIFQAERFPGRPHSDGMFSISLKRAA